MAAWPLEGLGCSQVCFCPSKRIVHEYLIADNASKVRIGRGYQSVSHIEIRSAELSDQLRTIVRASVEDVAAVGLDTMVSISDDKFATAATMIKRPASARQFLFRCHQDVFVHGIHEKMGQVP
jgi:hypothetical protein